MRQFIFQKTIRPRPRKCTQKRQPDNRRPRTDLSEQRAGTRTRHGPSEAKQQAAVHLSFVKRFGLIDDCFTR